MYGLVQLRLKLGLAFLFLWLRNFESSGADLERSAYDSSYTNLKFTLSFQRGGHFKAWLCSVEIATPPEDGKKKKWPIVTVHSRTNNQKQ